MMNIAKLIIPAVSLALTTPLYADTATDLANVITQGSSEFVRSINGNAKTVTITGSNLRAEVRANNATIEQDANVTLGISVTGQNAHITGSDLYANVRADNLHVGRDARFKAGIVVGGN